MQLKNTQSVHSDYFNFCNIIDYMHIRTPLHFARPNINLIVSTFLARVRGFATIYEVL